MTPWQGFYHQHHGDTAPCPQGNNGICSKHLWVPRDSGDGHDAEQRDAGLGGDGSPGIGATSCPWLGPEMSPRNLPAC